VGQVTGGTPVRHAGGRTEVDQRLQVFGAAFAGDVRGQRLAGCALAQYTVTACATLEVDLLRAGELGFTDVRCARSDDHLAAFNRARCALVFQLRRGRRRVANVLLAFTTT